MDVKSASGYVAVASDWATSFVYYLEDPHNRISPFTIRVTREPRVVGVGNKGTSGSSLGDDVGGSQNLDEPRGR